MLAPLQLQTLMPVDAEDLGRWWTTQRWRIDAASRPIFDSLMLLISWCVWKERNARVFALMTSTAGEVIRAIMKEAADWAAAGYAPMSALELLWSQNTGIM